MSVIIILLIWVAVFAVVQGIGWLFISVLTNLNSPDLSEMSRHALRLRTLVPDSETELHSTLRRSLLNSRLTIIAII